MLRGCITCEIIFDFFIFLHHNKLRAMATIYNDLLQRNPLIVSQSAKFFLFTSLQTRNGGTVTTVDTIWLERGGGVSKLTLSKLENDDEGNYSCRSNGFESDAVTLRIVSEDVEEGERGFSEIQSVLCDYVVLMLLCGK